MTDRIQTIRDGISEEWETRPAGSTNPLSALDSLAADLEAAREALEAIVAYVPEGFISQMDDEDSMNYRAIARAALARLSAGKEGA